MLLISVISNGWVYRVVYCRRKLIYYVNVDFCMKVRKGGDQEYNVSVTVSETRTFYDNETKQTRLARFS